MAKVPACKVCGKKEQGKYRCPIDHVFYCSVACYKQHKETCSSRDNYKPSSSTSVLQPRKEQDVVETRPTKRLKDLDWPEEPDDSLWTDPLSKTDIKPLRHIEYEAVATDGRIRELLTTDTVDTLKRLSKLYPKAREQNIRTMLGVPAEPVETTYRPSNAQSTANTPVSRQRKPAPFHVTEKERGQLLKLFETANDAIQDVRRKKGETV